MTPVRVVTLLLAIACGAAVCFGADPVDTGPSPRTARTGPSPAEINAAIERGVKFLLSQQQRDGGWLAYEEDADPMAILREPDVTAPRSDPDGGRTALATLALIAAGQPIQSPPIQRALAYLDKVETQRTYSMALRAAVYAQMPTGTRRRQLQEHVKWLMSTMINDGRHAGMYSYTPGSASGDLSNSQYGVLGVWYAADAGVEVPLNYWRKIDTAWRRAQNPDGGWAYTPDGGATSYTSMSAAGLATLSIASDYLSTTATAELRPIPGDRHLRAGTEWLAHHFNPRLNRYTDPNYLRNRSANARHNADRDWHVHYMLYTIERVGEATGLVRFGEHRWYDQGAAFLLETQARNGSWRGSTGHNEDTSFALLFLSRGRAPVAIQKLQYDGRWNNRPRDASTFTRWLRRQTERHLNWQVVPTDATVDELLDAPILYVTGDLGLRLTEAQQVTLRTYLDRGGTLVAANDGPADRFTTSVEQLLAKYYPNYTWRDLPPDHPIFTAHYPVESYPFPVRGLSNGVRELAILLPKGDTSWLLQSNAIANDRFDTAPRSSTQSSIPPRARIFQLLGNLYLHVTGKTNPRYKGDSHWVDADPAIKPERQILIARLQHRGNWNPEPAAWQRLANVLHNSDRIELRTRTISLTETPNLLDNDIRLAHLTSTGAIELTAAELRHLKQWLDNGGTLLFDSAGGNADATRAFEALMWQLYPESKPVPIPASHAIVATPLPTPLYRKHNPTGRPDDTVSLRVYTANNRILAIHSPDDLSAALAAFPHDQIRGYTPPTATELLRRLILSLHR